MDNTNLKTHVSFAIILSLLSIAIAAAAPSNLTLGFSVGITSLGIIYIALVILRDPN